MMKKPDEAITQGNEAITGLEATGALVPGWLYALGFAHLVAQHPEEGLKVVAKALQVGDRTGDAEAKSELYRLKGELLRMLNPTDTPMWRPLFVRLSIPRENSSQGSPSYARP